jgi:proteasome accessory factor B
MTFAELRRAPASTSRTTPSRPPDVRARQGRPAPARGPHRDREVAFGDELGLRRRPRRLRARRRRPDPRGGGGARDGGAADRAEGEHAGAEQARRPAPDPADLDARPTTRVELAPDPVDDVADAVLPRQTPALHLPDRRRAAGRADGRSLRRRPAAGAWYLVGRDHDRDALRAFRLDRVGGRPRIVGAPAASSCPTTSTCAAAVSGPESESGRRRAGGRALRPVGRRSRGGRDTGRTHDGMPGGAGPRARPPSATGRGCSVSAPTWSCSRPTTCGRRSSPRLRRSPTRAARERGDDVARMLTLVPWLLERPGASLTETAEHLRGRRRRSARPRAPRLLRPAGSRRRRPVRVSSWWGTGSWCGWPTSCVDRCVRRPGEALRLVLTVDAVAEALGDELPALRSAVAKVRGPSASRRSSPTCSSRARAASSATAAAPWPPGGGSCSPTRDGPTRAATAGGRPVGAARRGRRLVPAGSRPRGG